MNNTFNLSIFDYVKEIAPYKFVALAYEKILGEQFIDEEMIFMPFELDEEKELAKYLSNKTVSPKFISLLDNFIAVQNLDNEFCMLIKENPVLRYLVAIGFHDARIMHVDHKNNNLTIKINFSGCISAPNLDKEQCNLNFINAHITHLDNYKDFYIDDFRIGFHSGKLAFQLTLHNRGANLITKTLEISCENVSFS